MNPLLQLNVLIIISAIALIGIDKLPDCRPPRWKKRIKNIAMSAMLLLSAVCQAAADEPQSFYTKGRFGVTPFAAARVVGSEAEFGGGIAASYAITERLTFEADAISEGIDDSNWQDAVKSAGAGLKFYFPIKATGFAPYLLGGYQRDLIDHENRLQAGAGLEYRFNRAAIFIDAQANHGFEQELRELGNDVRVRAGLSISLGKN